MSRHRGSRLAPQLLLILSFVTPAATEPLSSGGEMDIGALLERAKASYDLGMEDGIVLFESRREERLSDGRRLRSVHSIVYILTEHALARYADSRIPYDGSRERLSVQALRTWRPGDRRWIESGPTARVETLPFAVDHAPDYAFMREMMLLHDGVELPCVLETAYTIEDLVPFRRGVDGLHGFAGADPVLISRLVLGFAGADPPAYAASAEVPAPARGHDENTGLDTLTFEIGPIDPRPRPWIDTAAYKAPHVSWSTWESWEELGRELSERFRAAQRLDGGLRDASSDALKTARSGPEKVQRILELVGEATRPVDYEIARWDGPRPAARTWSTAYGDRLDRAALAAALLREAGLQAELALVGPALEGSDHRVPTLEWSTGVGLWISGEGVEGYVEPDSRALPGSAALWRPASDPAPFGIWGDRTAASRIDVLLELGFDEKDQKWRGEGVLTATRALSPFHRMVGLKTEARDYLGELTGSVIAGSKVTGYNPLLFGPDAVTVAFEMEAPADERDELNRLRLTIAAPGEIPRLLERAAVRLYDEKRESHIELPTALEQHVELYLDLEGLEVVHLPEELVIENEAGHFASSSTRDEEKQELHLSRSLSLTKAEYPPAEWPSLRALLLAEEHEGRRLLLLE